MSATQVRQQPNKDVGGYVPTVPRGPIAAQYNSPGPCYALPGLVGQNNHDSRSIHMKYPGWAFGIKHGKMKDDCSPGPKYLPSHKIYRDGTDGTPHYSLYSRSKDMTQFRTPGPGAYRSESAGQSTYYRAPQHIFGIRHRHRRTDNVPGPNCYNLPNMTGKTTESHKKAAPVYSITGRKKVGSFAEDLAKTPGPGTYNTTKPSTYKNESPHFSMTSRNVMPGDGTQKPGPGAHSPEKVYYSTKRRAPSFAFGVRHSQYTAPLIVEPVE